MSPYRSHRRRRLVAPLLAAGVVLTLTGALIVAQLPEPENEAELRQKVDAMTQKHIRMVHDLVGTDLRDAGLMDADRTPLDLETQQDRVLLVVTPGVCPKAVEVAQGLQDSSWDHERADRVFLLTKHSNLEEYTRLLAGDGERPPGRLQAWTLPEALPEPFSKIPDAPYLIVLRSGVIVSSCYDEHPLAGGWSEL